MFLYYPSDIKSLVLTAFVDFFFACPGCGLRVGSWRGHWYPQKLKVKKNPITTVYFPDCEEILMHISNPILDLSWQCVLDLKTALILLGFCLIFLGWNIITALLRQSCICLKFSCFRMFSILHESYETKILLE